MRASDDHEIADMKKDDNQDLELLLSSYLDDELTQSQAQKVEKQLAEDQAARQLLVDLQQVAGWVGELPKERAPDHLGEDILFELERHQLLNSHESISERAGKNHLFLRRFIAAAALIFLVGVVGTIAYQVLFAPIEPPDTETAIVAKEQTPSFENQADKKQKLATADSHREVLVDETALSYGSIALEVLAPSSPSEGMIENLLTELAIERFVPIHLDDRNRQYAFMCQAWQLSDLFAKLETQPDHQVRVIVTDTNSNRQIVLTKIDGLQLLQLAVAADPSRQFALANKFKNLSIEPETQIANRLVKTDSPFQANPNQPLNEIENESQTLLPDWLADTWVKNEPELTDLELLGPTNWPKNEKLTNRNNEPPELNHEPDIQDNAEFVEQNTIPVAIPAIDTDQLVAIVLTYKVQKKSVANDNTASEPKN